LIVGNLGRFSTTQVI